MGHHQPTQASWKGHFSKWKQKPLPKALAKQPDQFKPSRAAAPRLQWRCCRGGECVWTLTHKWKMDWCLWVVTQWVARDSAWARPWSLIWLANWVLAGCRRVAHLVLYATWAWHSIMGLHVATRFFDSATLTATDAWLWVMLGLFFLALGHCNGDGHGRIRLKKDTGSRSICICISIFYVCYVVEK